MRISELVKVKRLLSELDVSAFTKELGVFTSDTTTLSNVFGLSYADQLKQYFDSLADINKSIDNIKSAITQLTYSVDAEIEKLGNEYSISDNIVKSIRVSGKSSVERDRTVRYHIYDDTTVNAVVSRIRLYTGPRYPVLEIGPGDGFWTKFLVAGDPLYIVDIHQEFLDSTVNHFPEDYRRRICPYLLGHHGVGEQQLDVLPVGQFGFVLAMNVLDYYPLDFTTEYLRQVYNVLKPGGVMLFTYNNCEDFHCATYVDRGFKAWQPEIALIQICKDLGFEVVKSESADNHVYWLEIKRPGTLQTVKTHQALGEICLLGT
jgi:SAM-dependent methyltransferase